MEIRTSFPKLKELLPTQPGLRALLFDMDGTLFKTEEIHGAVLRQLASNWGLRPPFPPSEVEERLKGMSDTQVLELAKSWEGFPPHMNAAIFIQEKNKLLLQLIPTLEIKTWCSEELMDFIDESKRGGLLVSVVTSSERVITNLLLKLSGLDKILDLVITLQDVAIPKPHPGPYLKAMLTLGVGPRETIIFEDSPPGLVSATASGARVIQAAWWS